MLTRGRICPDICSPFFSAGSLSLASCPWQQGQHPRAQQALPGLTSRQQGPALGDPCWLGGQSQRAAIQSAFPSAAWPSEPASHSRFLSCKTAVGTGSQPRRAQADGMRETLACCAGAQRVVASLCDLQTCCLEGRCAYVPAGGEGSPGRCFLPGLPSSSRLLRGWTVRVPSCCHLSGDKSPVWKATEELMVSGWGWGPNPAESAPSPVLLPQHQPAHSPTGRGEN